MQICTLQELERQNYNAVFVKALQQFWRTERDFQCIGTPKKQNLLLLLQGCKIAYTDIQNRRLTAESGEIVYIPTGSEYRLHVYDFQNNAAHTVAIHFHLLDERGEPFILSDRIEIFPTKQNDTLPLLFHRILREDIRYPVTKSRILLMEVLCALSAHISCCAQPSIPQELACALQYLSDHMDENPTVAELAKRCNISEVYFRKQVKAYTGMSPLEYRNSLRMNRACTYLTYGEISVQELSELLGYATVSHFIKAFRTQYGCTPLHYRKLKRMET